MSDDKDQSSSEEGVDSGEAMRWAADEPTAMWDESLLGKEGFDELVEDRKANPRAQTGPATNQAVGGRSKSGSIEVSSSVTGSHPAVTGGAKKKQAGISWVLTIGLAVGLGVVVYLLVRLLR